jgi:putative transposase
MKLQRARRLFAGDGDGIDRRWGSLRHVAHCLSEEHRQLIVLTCNEPEFAVLPLGEALPIFGGRGRHIGSERSFFCFNHAHAQFQLCCPARRPQVPSPVPRLRATGPNQVLSLKFTHLPLSCEGCGYAST